MIGCEARLYIPRGMMIKTYVYAFLHIVSYLRMLHLGTPNFDYVRMAFVRRA
jgi:hypothetical protein